MNARDLERKLVEILGEGEEEGEEYYDEYTGINAFYHILANAAPYPDYLKWDDEKFPRGGESITIPGLGVFKAVDYKVEFMAESGDADANVIFEFEGNFYQKHGYLDSYEGGVWDGMLTQVKPVEKTITVWESL